MTAIPLPPAADALLDAATPSPEALAFLNRRRSCPAPALEGTGPDRQHMAHILRLATRVPDHRRLEPWRFLIFEGEARTRAGDLFARRFAQLHEGASADDLRREKARFCCAPVVVAVISSPDKAHKTPVWEQELSAGALCYNLLLVANAAGWAGSWLTQWIASDEMIAAAFGLGEGERVAGFIHLGRARAPVRERPRPAMASRMAYWGEN